MSPLGMVAVRYDFAANIPFRPPSGQIAGSEAVVDNCETGHWLRDVNGGQEPRDSGDEVRLLI